MLAEAFAAETDLSVWQRILGGLNALDRLVDGDAREALRGRVRDLRRAPPSTASATTPRPDDTDRERALRGVLFEALGTLGDDPDVHARARVLLDAGALAPDPALVAASVNVVAAWGTAADFDDFVARMKAAATPQEEQRYLGALADFPDPELVRRLLAMSITDEVRTQNAPLLLRRALTNRDHGALAWFFVADEWDTINARFPSNSIARLLEGIRSLSAPSVAPEVFVFFEDHEVPQGDKILAQHLERLEVNVALRAREAEALADELLGRPVSARHTRRLPRMEIWPGEPFPLGATFDGSGCNFSLFSEVAERVELCLFDEDGTETRVDAARGHRLRAPRLPARASSPASATASGCTARGPREQGSRCNPEQAADRPLRQGRRGRASSGPRPSSPTRSPTAPTGPPTDSDSGPFIPKSVVVNPYFDWADDRHPRTPVARDRRLRDPRQGPHPAPPRRARGPARHLPRPVQPAGHRPPHARSASPPSSSCRCTSSCTTTASTSRACATTGATTPSPTSRRTTSTRCTASGASRCRSSSRW